jgi:two-component system sensor histidine kinase BaeS
MSPRIPGAGRRRWSQQGLAPRLLAAQALVLAAGALTAWLVASLVASGLFRDHLRRAGVSRGPEETAHIEEAFASAVLIALLVALLVAVAVALAVSSYFARRVQRSIAGVAVSASEIAAGRYGARLVEPGLGAEFERLTVTINHLAERLDATETTRRRMLADLAHELRTPLATIDAQLEAVEDGLRDMDDETLGVLRGSTARLTRLAHDMSTVSAAEEHGVAVARTPRDPVALVHEAVAAVAERFEAKGVALRTVPQPAPQILADSQRLGQVLGNLLDNALRHTPAGGAVTVTLRGVAGGGVEIAVADTGEGVADGHLPHLFDRFFRADAARGRHGGSGGSGIGLTISRAIVEAHGGRIDVESRGLGHGATFRVWLPGLGASVAGKGEQEWESLESR